MRCGEAARPKAAAKIVLGVIGSDCHSVGNRILALVLEEAGFEVVNLGVMVSQEEFINAAIESAAGAILISSLYGHGEIDCAGLREKCIEKGLERILLYVGGNLVVGKADKAEVQRKFLAMGYDRVYAADADLGEAVRQLKADLRIA